MLEVGSRTKEVLPKRALAKMLMLSSAHDDARALETAARAPLKAINARRDPLRVKAAVKPLTSDEASALEALDAEHATVMKIVNERNRSVRDAAQLLTRTNAFVAPFENTHYSASDMILIDADRQPWEVPPEGPRARIGILREKITATKTEMARVAAAPMPPEEIRSSVERTVSDLAMKGRPRLGTKRAHARAPSGTPSFSFETGTSAAAIVAWLDPVAFEERVMRELAPSGEGAMSGAAKEEEGDRLAGVLLDLEREEEFMLCASADPIPRRLDADPKAVLGVEERPRKRREAVSSV